MIWRSEVVILQRLTKKDACNGCFVLVPEEQVGVIIYVLRHA